MGWGDSYLYRKKQNIDIPKGEFKTLKKEIKKRHGNEAFAVFQTLQMWGESENTNDDVLKFRPKVAQAIRELHEHGYSETILQEWANLNQYMRSEINKRDGGVHANKLQKRIEDDKAAKNDAWNALSPEEKAAILNKKRQDLNERFDKDTALYIGFLKKKEEDGTGENVYAIRMMRDIKEDEREIARFVNLLNVDGAIEDEGKDLFNMIVAYNGGKCEFRDDKGQLGGINLQATQQAYQIIMQSHITKQGILNKSIEIFEELLASESWQGTPSIEALREVMHQDGGWASEAQLKEDFSPL